MALYTPEPGRFIANTEVEKLRQLVEVLPQLPPPALPVSLLYPHNRQLPARARAFVEWTRELFARQAALTGEKRRRAPAGTRAPARARSA